MCGICGYLWYPGGGRQPEAKAQLDRMMDAIAHHLGADPADIRRRNYFADGPGHTQTTPYGQTVDGFLLGAMTDALLTTSDYEARRADADVRFAPRSGSAAVSANL